MKTEDNKNKVTTINALGPGLIYSAFDAYIAGYLLISRAQAIIKSTGDKSPMDGYAELVDTLEISMQEMIDELDIRRKFRILPVKLNYACVASLIEEPTESPVLPDRMTRQLHISMKSIEDVKVAAGIFSIICYRLANGEVAGYAELEDPFDTFFTQLHLSGFKRCFMMDDSAVFSRGDVWLKPDISIDSSAEDETQDEIVNALGDDMDTELEDEDYDDIAEDIPSNSDSLRSLSRDIQTFIATSNKEQSDVVIMATTAISEQLDRLEASEQVNTERFLWLSQKMDELSTVAESRPSTKYKSKRA